MRRGLAIWFLIMGVETVHGILRELFLVPLVGIEASGHIGWPIGLLLIYLIAFVSVRWIGLTRTGPLLRLGVLWAGLALLFEVAIGLARGYDSARILAEFNPLSGGLMGVGLVAMALAPLAASRFRGIAG